MSCLFSCCCPKKDPVTKARIPAPSKQTKETKLKAETESSAGSGPTMPVRNLTQTGAVTSPRVVTPPTLIKSSLPERTMPGMPSSESFTTATISASASSTNISIAPMPAPTPVSVPAPRPVPIPHPLPKPAGLITYASTTSYEHSASSTPPFSGSPPPPLVLYMLHPSMPVTTSLPTADTAVFAMASSQSSSLITPPTAAASLLSGFVAKDALTPVPETEEENKEPQLAIHITDPSDKIKPYNYIVQFKFSSGFPRATNPLPELLSEDELDPVPDALEEEFTTGEPTEAEKAYLNWLNERMKEIRQQVPLPVLLVRKVKPMEALELPPSTEELLKTLCDTWKSSIGESMPMPLCQLVANYVYEAPKSEKPKQEMTPPASHLSPTRRALK